MIIESIIGSITIIFVSTLIFANATIKKVRQWEVEDMAPDPDPEPEPESEPIIDPFIHIVNGTPCPKCLRC
jgi:hypothetical protein